MKNKLTYTSVILLAALLTSCAIQPAQNSSQQVANAATSAPPVAEQPAIAVNPPKETSNSNKYVEYSRAAYDESAHQRRVLFFYADWCSTCRPADASLQKNVDRFPNDLVVIRVNYNDNATDQEEKELAAKYGITYQHTFIQVDVQGNVVTRWNGGEIDQLLSKIQ